MTKEEAFNAPKYAGVYLFRNKVNGKCYVGQAIKLRKRLLDHWNHYLSNRYEHIPLYRAFKKWGIDNFDLVILETIHNALAPDTKDKLDELEKKYIEKYNSYGDTGYNATKGGDAGVLGLKQTDETKERIRQASLKTAREQNINTENWIKAKNIKTGEIYISTRICYLQRILKCKGSAGIQRCLKNQQKTLTSPLGTFILARYLEDFPEVSAINGGKYTRKYSYDLVFSILNQNPGISYKEFSLLYTMPLNTFKYFKSKANKNMIKV